MFQGLIGKQVVCSNLYILQFMYPTFKIVKDKYSIYSNEPFIYVGKSFDIMNMKLPNIPYIIVSSSGEYNLDDRNELISLAFKKHRKKISKAIIEILESMDDEDFLYNWKFLWVLGSCPREEYQIFKYNSFTNLLNNLRYPNILLITYIKKLGTIDWKDFEEMLMTFIDNSMSDKKAKTEWLSRCQDDFKKLYGKNVSPAVKKFIESPAPINDMKIMRFLKDILFGVGY